MECGLDRASGVWCDPCWEWLKAAEALKEAKARLKANLEAEDES